MKLGIDLDGVVYNFGEAWENYVKRNWNQAKEGEFAPMWAHALYKRFPVQLPARGKTWDFYEEYGLDWDGFEEICHDGVDEGYIFRVGKPFEGAKYVLEKLQDEGHSIHIITHRFFGSLSHSSTEAWLNNNEIPFDTLTFAKDKSIVGVDLLLDDLDKNLDAMPIGTILVMMGRVYNRNMMKDSYLRVSTWPEFYQLVHRRAWSHG